MNRLQKIGVVLFVLLSAAYCLFFFQQYGQKNRVFYGDALGYYAYLPSTFIYHNFNSQDSLPEDRNINLVVLNYFKTYRSDQQKSPKGYYINQYTCGIAILEAPFFFAAHAIELSRGAEANGYSDLYAWFIKLSSIVYAFLGFFFLFKSLRKYFNPWQTWMLCALLMMGTNLFYMTWYQSGMAHLPVFFLVSLLIYSTSRVYETPSLKWFLILGFCVGMIALIRPTDILFGFIPLLYTGLNWQEKKAFFLRYWKFIVAAAVLAFLLILPQLIYWKILSGQFLFYSYGSQGFNWKHPEIKLGLFGAGNGWLVYSPIMLFSMAGMLFYRKIKPFGLALWVIFPLYVYVIYSWYCFFYLNGIGSRPMIHLYPLLAFPMMVCLNFIWRKQGVLKFVLILFVGFTLAMNINFSLKKINKLLWSEGATYGFLRETFFRNYLTYNDLVTQDINVSQPDTNQLHWMGSLSNMVVTDTAGYLETKEFSDSVVTYVLQEKDILPKAYIKCSGQFNVDGRLEDVYRSQVMQVKVEKGSEMLSGYGVRINNKMGIQAMEKRGDHSFKVYTVLDYGWDELSFFIHLPKKAAAGDKITFRTWNTSWLPLHIKYLKLDLYQSK